MKIQRSCCNALIGTEQEQINQLYEIVKALAGNYFEGFEIMGTYNTATNYDKKYMLVFYNGGTYVKTVDGDSINFAPDLHPDKWALFTYPAQGERGPKGEGGPNPVLYRHLISIDISDPDGVEIPIILNIIHYNGLNNQIISLTDLATFAKLSFTPVVCCIYSGNVSNYNGVATFLYIDDSNTIEISGLLGDGTNYSKTINTDDFLISITDTVELVY